MTAHYFASRKTKVLLIYRGPSMRSIDDRIAEHAVAGKAEARKIAAQYGATCWNF